MQEASPTVVKGEASGESQTVVQGVHETGRQPGDQPPVVWRKHTILTAHSATTLGLRCQDPGLTRSFSVRRGCCW